MRPTRRKTLLGMGALATGSGALFSNAAFSTSTTSAADLRVLVEERGLVFRGNPDAPDEEDNIVDTDDFENFFDGEDIDDSDEGAFSDGNAPPLAATNEATNEELDIFAVAGLGESARFSDLFILENNTDAEVNVGIAYDRNNEELGTVAGQYGEDVLGTGELTPAVSRHSYRFEVSDTADFFNGDTDGLISPAENGDADGEVNEGNADNAGGVNDSISDARDRPADGVTLGAGESVSIDLVVNTIKYETEITDQADINEDDGFSVQRDTVDLLDGITVGTLEEPSS